MLKIWRRVDVCILYSSKFYVFTQGSLGLGRHVRRVVLPRANAGDVGHSNHWATRDTQRIIDCCPNITELSRYHDLFVKPARRLQSLEPLEGLEGVFTPQYDPPLPQVRRIDWDNGTPPHMGRTVGSAPSTIWTSHTLVSLSLSGDNYFWNAADLQSWGGSTVSLPNLHTLRINSLYAFGVPGVSTYILAVPRLRRVILDRAEALHRLIECVLAPQSNPSAGRSVAHVEIGAPYWRCLHSDYISSLVKHCPNAETLHYPLFFARVLRWRRVGDGRTYPQATMMFPNLKRVGWHGATNIDLWTPENARIVTGETNVSAEGRSGGGVLWVHLMRHLRALVGDESRTPGIEEIALHGRMWDKIVPDMRFHSVLDLLAQLSVKLVAQETHVAELLEETDLEYRTDTILCFIQSL